MQNFTLIIPYYKDSKTIELVVKKAVKFLDNYAKLYEIIIVNDGSPDNPFALLNKIKKKYSNINILHHKNNLGYGATFKSGFTKSQYDLILMIDGDDEYDIFEFKKFLNLIDYYELIIGFRYKKLYSTKRIFISYFYNFLVRFMFKTNFRDISTGIRFAKKSLFESINFDTLSNSPFFGAELVIRAMVHGFPIGQVGIQTFPRSFGTGSSITFKNIYLTIKDLIRVYKNIFSDDYDLPEHRYRKRGK